MVYNVTNSYDSRFVSLGKPIPGVTGRSFYPRAATTSDWSATNL